MLGHSWVSAAQYIKALAVKTDWLTHLPLADCLQVTADVAYGQCRSPASFAAGALPAQALVHQLHTL